MLFKNGDKGTLIHNMMNGSMTPNDEKVLKNSFLDLIGQNHEFDFKKIGSKSIAYNSLQLRKMRAIYGKRGTFQTRGTRQ